MGKWQNYSDREIGFIKDNFIVMSDEQIASALNRTAIGIRAKRVFYGFAKPVSFESINTKYNKTRELAQLRKMADKGILKQLVLDRMAELENMVLIEKQSIRTPLKDQARIYELHMMGLSQAKIGLMYKLHWTTVKKIVKNIMPEINEPIYITRQSKV